MWRRRGRRIVNVQSRLFFSIKCVRMLLHQLNDYYAPKKLCRNQVRLGAGTASSNVTKPHTNTEHGNQV